MKHSLTTRSKVAAIFSEALSLEWISVHGYIVVGKMDGTYPVAHGVLTAFATLRSDNPINFFFRGSRRLHLIEVGPGPGI